MKKTVVIFFVRLAWIRVRLHKRESRSRTGEDGGGAGEEGARDRCAIAAD